jgi:cytochrome oxidase Cu insertion factor (SCO1/SenC/PrrC family)
VAALGRRRGLIALGVAPLVVLGVAFAMTNSPSTTTPADSSDGATAPGYAAPLRLTSIDGKQISLPAGRPGMVMFSSSYCATCFVSASFMARYRAEAPERVDAAFVSVDPGDSPDALADRRAALSAAPYPFAIDPTGNLAAQYGITSLGTVIIYDATGKIVSRVVEPSLQDLRAGFREAGVA